MDDTEAASLAGKFKTRSSADIIDALGTILGAQTERANRAIQAENNFNDAAEQNGEQPKFSPEVTKMLATTFDQGVTLARLVDPSLGAMTGSGKGKRVINASLAQEIGGATPQQLAAGFVGELEKAGYDINDLTPEQAEEVLSRIVPSGTIPEHDDDDAPEGAQANGAGGNPLVAGAPSLRATPRFNP